MAQGMYRLKINTESNAIYDDLTKWEFDDGRGTKIRFVKRTPERGPSDFLMVISQEQGQVSVHFDGHLASFLLDAAAATWGLELQPTVANWVEEVTDEHE